MWCNIAKLVCVLLLCSISSACSLWKSQGPSRPALSFAPINQKVAGQMACNISAGDFPAERYQQELNDALERAINEFALKRDSDVIAQKRQVELMNNLFYGLLIPNHSQVVAQEFRKVFAANGPAPSPTLGLVVDYALFAPEKLAVDEQCYPDTARFPLFVIAVYAHHLTAQDWAWLVEEQHGLAVVLEELVLGARSTPV